jgi:hypothetical protein
MTDPKPRTRTRSTLRALSLLFVVLGSLAAAGALVARGAGLGGGGDTAADLERALDGVFVAEGFDRAALVAKRTSAERGPSPVELRAEIPSADGYARVNAAISRAVEAAGGRIVDAVEKGPSPERPDAVELYVGTSREITHRVTLRPERPFGAVEGADAPRIALVFDDLGYTTQGLAAELLDLGIPLTFAVLPGLPKSASFAEAARAKGHEVILHLPMEPLDAQRHDPGRGALLTTLPPEENARRVRAAFDGVPAFTGVSNHMGSRATSTAETVDLVISEMKRRGGRLFFLDSRTTPHSVVPERARRAGVPWLSNNLFLDGGDEEPALPEVQTGRLEAIARLRGKAIGIGHVRPRTVEAVRRAVERWETEGIRLVRLSEVSVK